MEALGDRVVPAVGDHEVDVWEYRRLRQELGADHVVGELEELVLRPLRHDHAMRTAREGRHERPHQLEIGRAEAAQTQIYELSITVEGR
jgi:hypothetical protein